MKVEKLIPEVYYSQSRDFSYIGRLLEILFNYMKTGADCISVNPNSVNIDATIIELMALTLGFESKHRYVTRDLIYVISSFSNLIRKKGSKTAIIEAIKLLMNSQKIETNLLTDADFIFINDYVLTVNIPEQMTDTILLEDLFDYILPTGMLYKFNRVIPQPKNVSTLAVEPAQTLEYYAPYDNSFVVADDEGDYTYILLTVVPDDWSEHYENYYVYDNATESFITNTDSM